jgi:hypothetical protein
MASFANALALLLKRGRSPNHDTGLEAHSGERISVARDEMSVNPSPRKSLRIDGDSDYGSVSVADDIDDSEDSFSDSIEDDCFDSLRECARAQPERGCDAAIDAEFSLMAEFDHDVGVETDEEPGASDHEVESDDDFDGGGMFEARRARPRAPGPMPGPALRGASAPSSLDLIYSGVQSESRPAMAVSHCWSRRDKRYIGPRAARQFALSSESVQCASCFKCKCGTDVDDDGFWRPALRRANQYPAERRASATNADALTGIALAWRRSCALHRDNTPVPRQGRPTPRRCLMGRSRCAARRGCAAPRG